ncbi:MULTISPECIES: hypothetical protein [Streptomyces]|uniref:hypothetical protein n=1 Tax=Streptomyces TaxID=1883 RepID=UPI00103F56B4|nr:MULTISPECIES: hypothetical protein [Streptomyces]MBT3077626.1 hypothetical protein [Streptomyces sp. COG21]MBT3084472.1 hypothetical protein [Streptomyces sp. COG20]MBT3085379.1 hypothetical protein [Streptomyces sp. CYG21]MBT3098971.1 hypothetical protein [Streptomyces sp. CBG30]MBT3103579.1 hypothetical protein [Streptomyces sp. COG19]
MIDNLGFHTDRDLHGELATLNREITALAGRLDIGNFHSWEARYNTESRLANLQGRANQLAAEVAVSDADTDRLLSAIRLVGDPTLGFIAYVIYGPVVLPVPPLHEVRLIERDGGYTVPGTVRRRVPADQVAAVERELLTGVVAPGGHAQLWGRTIRAYRTQVTAY